MAHPPVGIDLGTTFSVVAHLDAEGRPWTIRNAEGDLTTPSVVFFDKGGAIVGKEAVAAGEFEPDRVAQFAKRDVGETTYEKPIRGETLPPEVVQALVLKKLKADAELKLGPIEKAVVTVPAFFNEPCRRATWDAARLAGLKVLDIINEPTAAAVCYGVEHGFLAPDGEAERSETILVYDLGGGTFDVTVMRIEGRSHTAIATAGDVYLGGIDFDRRIVDHVAELFEEEHGVDPRSDETTYQQLLHKAAEAKHALSQREEMSFFFAHDGLRFRTTITRAQFESLVEDLVDRTLMTVRKALREARLEFGDLTRLLLVGGSTRIPAIGRMLERETGLAPDRALSPDEAVAHGAAFYAGMLLKSGHERIDGLSVTNVNSHDLGVLGVEKSTGRPRRSLMIPRNSSLPLRVSKTFPTQKDDQRTVKINVVEGGDDSGNNATRLGRFVIRDLPEGLPARTPVKVAFEYGTDGRLTVTARLPTIDRDATLEIDRARGLDEAKFETWRNRVAEGMPDSSVPSEDAVEVEVALGEDVEPAAAEPPVKVVEAVPVENDPAPAAKPVKKLVKLAKRVVKPANDVAPPVPVEPEAAEPEVEFDVVIDTGDSPRPAGKKPASSPERRPSPKRRKPKPTESSPPEPKKDWRSRAKKLEGDE